MPANLIFNAATFAAGIVLVGTAQAAPNPGGAPLPTGKAIVMYFDEPGSSVVLLPGRDGRVDAIELHEKIDERIESHRERGSWKMLGPDWCMTFEKTYCVRTTALRVGQPTPYSAVIRDRSGLETGRFSGTLLLLRDE